MPQNARFGVQNVFCMNEMCWQSKVGESSFLPERKDKFYNTGNSLFEIMSSRFRTVRMKHQIPYDCSQGKLGWVSEIMVN